MPGLWPRFGRARQHNALSHDCTEDTLSKHQHSNYPDLLTTTDARHRFALLSNQPGVEDDSGAKKSRPMWSYSSTVNNQETHRSNLRQAAQTPRVSGDNRSISPHQHRQNIWYTDSCSPRKPRLLQPRKSIPNSTNPYQQIEYLLDQADDPQVSPPRSIPSQAKLASNCSATLIISLSVHLAPRNVTPNGRSVVTTGTAMAHKSRTFPK